MSDGICKSCKFLRASECRKNPPTLISIHPTAKDHMTSDMPQYTRHRAAWPTVAMHNWCGSYEERLITGEEKLQADAREFNKNKPCGDCELKPPLHADWCRVRNLE